MREIRAQLIDWVERWASGEFDETEVRDRAEELELRFEPPVDVRTRSPDFGNPDVATDQILIQLAGMHVTWITKDDIPAILDLLRAPDSDASAAWQRWRHYIDAIDWNRRGVVLRQNLFYATDAWNRDESIGSQEIRGG